MRSLFRIGRSAFVAFFGSMWLIEFHKNVDGERIFLRVTIGDHERGIVEDRREVQGLGLLLAAFLAAVCNSSKAERSRDGTPQHPRNDVVRSKAFATHLKPSRQDLYSHQDGDVQT